MSDNRTALFSRTQPGGVWTFNNLPEHPGAVWFVDSGHANALDSVGYGQNPDAPLATLDYAIGLCTASKNDVIYVMPGHAETKSATGSLWAADVIGVKIVGLGQGSLRPTFTFSHTGAVCTISAASTWLENVVLLCGVDSVLAPLTISAADVTLRNVELRNIANVEFVNAVTTTAAADRLTLDGVICNGDPGGNACVDWFKLVGVDVGLIRGCRFYGVASTACIELITTASTGLVIEDCWFDNVGTALSKNIVATVSGNTWTARNCYDLVGGYAFSGGSGAALAADDMGNITAAVAVIDEFHDVPAANNTLNAQMNEVLGNKSDTALTGAVSTTGTLVGYAKQIVTDVEAAATLHSALPRCVEKSDGAVLTGADPIFTITGGPVLAQIYGLVTTVIGGSATCTLQITTTTPAATVALNAAPVAINTAAAGTSFYNVGVTSVFTPVTAGVVLLDPVTVEPVWMLLPIGGVSALCSAAQTGVIKWYMIYKPLSPSSVVTAAA